MRAALSVLLVLAVAFTLTLSAGAEEKKADTKEVKLEGTITCAKCDLKKEAACTTVIVVKEKKDNKEVETIYYLDEKSGKDNHKTICQASAKGTVTGTVSEKGGKKIITATKVEFAKK